MLNNIVWLVVGTFSYSFGISLIILGIAKCIDYVDQDPEKQRAKKLAHYGWNRLMAVCAIPGFILSFLQVIEVLPEILIPL